MEYWNDGVMEGIGVMENWTNGVMVQQNNRVQRSSNTPILQSSNSADFKRVRRGDGW
jgi:hypothetical protein